MKKNIIYRNYQGNITQCRNNTRWLVIESKKIVWGVTRWKRQFNQFQLKKTQEKKFMMRSNAKTSIFGNLFNQKWDDTTFDRVYFISYLMFLMQLNYLQLFLNLLSLSILCFPLLKVSVISTWMRPNWIYQRGIFLFHFILLLFSILSVVFLVISTDRILVFTWIVLIKRSLSLYVTPLVRTTPTPYRYPFFLVCI